MKVTFEDEVANPQTEITPPLELPPPGELGPPPPPPLFAEDGTPVPGPTEPPPPYEQFPRRQPKPLPPFEADPALHILDMKIPKAKIGFCACSLRTTNFAIVFYITAYALLLVADAFGVIPEIIRTIYAYKFQLLLEKPEQYYLHGWIGAFLLISAFALWWATFSYNHVALMAWLCVMLLFTLMSFVMWLLGLLLSLSADGWNVPATQGISAGTIDIALEFYLLHMVYSYNRYMHDPPDVSSRYDPRAIARRQYELAQVGLQEINVMGVMLTTRLPRAPGDSPLPPPPPPV